MIIRSHPADEIRALKIQYHRSFTKRDRRISAIATLSALILLADSAEYQPLVQIAIKQLGVDRWREEGNEEKQKERLEEFEEGDSAVMGPENLKEEKEVSEKVDWSTFNVEKLYNKSFETMVSENSCCSQQIKELLLTRIQGKSHYYRPLLRNNLQRRHRGKESLNPPPTMDLHYQFWSSGSNPTSRPANTPYALLPLRAPRLQRHPNPPRRRQNARLCTPRPKLQSPSNTARSNK